MEMKTLLSLEKSQGLKFYHRNPAKEWTFFFFFFGKQSLIPPSFPRAIQIVVG